ALPLRRRHCNNCLVAGLESQNAEYPVYGSQNRRIANLTANLRGVVVEKRNYLAKNSLGSNFLGKRPPGKTSSNYVDALHEMASPGTAGARASLSAFSISVNERSIECE